MKNLEIAACFAVLLSVQSVFIFFFLSAILPEGGVPLDDAWIHFVFARNLAEQCELSFNSGQWSGGTTSLLWDLLLAGGYRLSGNMLLTAYGLGTFFYFTSTLSLFLLLNRVFTKVSGGWIAALLSSVAFASTSYIPYLALSGMDTLMFLAISLASLTAFVYGKDSFASWLLAILILIRPEGLGLLCVLCIAGYVQERCAQHHQWKRVLKIVLPASSVSFLYFLFNWLTTGYPLPTTIIGRKWLWGLPEKVWAFDLQRAWRFLRDWNLLFAGFIVFGEKPELLILFEASAVTGLVGFFVEAIRQPSQFRGMIILMAWVFLHNLAYLFLAPLASWRHQSPNLILASVLAVNGWIFLAQYLRPRFRKMVITLGGVLIILCLLPKTIIYREVFAWNVAHINRVHVAAGKWISTNLPEDIVLAAFDIGAVKYFGNRQTLDLGGLTDINFTHKYLYPEKVVDYLRENKASFIVIPEPIEGQTDLKMRLGFYREEQAKKAYLHPLVTFEIEPYIRPPFNSLQYQFYPAYLRITIYEIQWLQ